jgi:pRiA4b ORF-3-like protein
MTAESIVRLKITLDDVKPQVLRRIEAPLTLRLARISSSRRHSAGPACARRRRRRNSSLSHDFRDGWEHSIKIERVFDAGVQYPRLIEAVGRCRARIVAALVGYLEFHERHAELTEWMNRTKSTSRRRPKSSRRSVPMSRSPLTGGLKTRT